MFLTTASKYRQNTFSRRIAKGLSTNQKFLLNSFLPKIQINLDTDFKSLKDNYHNIHMEIGFGKGDLIINQALQNSQTLYIGCEIFLNGIASLLSKIQKLSIKNIRVYSDDARKLIEVLPDNYLEKVFIICPDPWPKRKQFKRRLINEEFLKFMYNKIISELIIATDHSNYAEWILKHLEKTEFFKLPSKELKYYETTPADWTLTKYQQRGKNLYGHNYFFNLTKHYNQVN